MKKKILNIIFQLVVIISFGQVKILPGDLSINKSYLKQSLTTMSFLVNQNNQVKEIGTYEIEIKFNTEKMVVNSTLFFKDSEKNWKDICIVNANNFEPISYSSDRDERFFMLNFSNKIDGEIIRKNNNEKKQIKELIKEKYFDINIYPHVLRSLPLKLGYKAIIPVYDYEATDQSKIYNVVLKEVKSETFVSTLTGNHNVWKVSVYEESTGHNLDYFIDKESRRLWQINIVSNEGQLMSLIDKESDYNPLKEKFDKESTFKLISEGKSSITGQVYGRANKNLDSWVTVVNWNPKQVAKKGTSVVLIPYTSWTKEYFEVNKQLKKVGRKYNMPNEALECILVTNIYDDEGHFEFTNLMPGKYFIFTQFEFWENKKKYVKTGETEVFLGGQYQGSFDNIARIDYSQSQFGYADEIVIIEKEGETKVVKLKTEKK